MRGADRLPPLILPKPIPSAAPIETVLAVTNEKVNECAWDIKQAYTHPSLKEEAYLRFPTGCGSIPGKVFPGFRFAPYGLKRRGRECGHEAADTTIENNYETSARLTRALSFSLVLQDNNFFELTGFLPSGGNSPVFRKSPVFLCPSVQLFLVCLIRLRRSVLSILDTFVCTSSAKPLHRHVSPRLAKEYLQ